MKIRNGRRKTHLKLHQELHVKRMTDRKNRLRHSMHVSNQALTRNFINTRNIVIRNSIENELSFLINFG